MIPQTTPKTFGSFPSPDKHPPLTLTSKFLSDNPSVWHAVEYFSKKLKSKGFTYLYERESWEGKLKRGGKYYTRRNGSSLIAFVVPENYKVGNGAAIVGGHIDALTARLKPNSTKGEVFGYELLGVAPYAGALNPTWLDRDLGIAGRVVLKENGKIVEKLVKLDYPIARIPTLAPHFGIATDHLNKETQMVPIIGLGGAKPISLDIKEGSFASTQPARLVKVIASELGISDYSTIQNWELELYDFNDARVGGIEKEFIFGGRIDDKLCSYGALEGFLAAIENGADKLEHLSVVGLFDDEEIGSRLRQGAMSNFIGSIFERIVEQFAEGRGLANLLNQTYANSFLVSADVTHAFHPNFGYTMDTKNSPKLNEGLCVCFDTSGHMTTDSVSATLIAQIAERSGSKLQSFHARNDVRSGGTIGPMTSAALGIRAIDAGLPQLSMHSIRATTGSLDPGLGVKIFAAVYEEWTNVWSEFEGFSH